MRGMHGGHFDPGMSQINPVVPELEKALVI
jgi:hypothetical protein